MYDFNTIIEEHDFYQRLTPRMQTELTQTLFGDFIVSFGHFFDHCEQGFINEFVVSMYARTFDPGQDIIRPGADFNEVYFIWQGQVAICEPSTYKEPYVMLPKHSFFGEYQCMLELKSVFLFRAIGHDEVDMYE